MVPDMPMPLPSIVDFMVTSASRGVVNAAVTSATRIERFISVISKTGEAPFYCCWLDVVLGLAFFAHSFDQFSISATVCSTDSRAA